MAGIVSKISVKIDLHNSESFNTFSINFINSGVFSANCTAFLLMFRWITCTEMKNLLFLGTMELHSKFVTDLIVCQNFVTVQWLKTCLNFALDEMLNCGYFQKPFLEEFFSSWSSRSSVGSIKMVKRSHINSLWIIFLQKMFIKVTFCPIEVSNIMIKDFDKSSNTCKYR